MKTLVAAAFFASLIAGAATAMPLGAVTPAPNASIIEVAGGCGAGWHRGPYGGCRPGGQAGGYRHGRPCPPGFHLGPYGRRCRPF